MIDAPHIDQYFGVWAIYEPVFRAAVDRVQDMDINLHVKQADIKAVSYTSADGTRLRDEFIRDGVALFSLDGPLMKHVSSMEDGTSTVLMRRAMRAAGRDERVQAIMLHIDSPGGTVAGTADLAADIAAVNKRKPVLAFIEDLGASAAYWLASQASEIIATPESMVGSIGTFAVLYDMSRLADRAGITVHVIRAGDMKGAGEPGTAITDYQLAEFQRLVDGLNKFFVRGVARGRGMKVEDVREIADGRVQIGREAMALRLVDGLGRFDEAFTTAAKRARGEMRSAVVNDYVELEDEMEIANINEQTRALAVSAQAIAADAEPVKTETQNMSDTTTQPQPATLADLKQACADEEADFYVHCLEQGMTVEQAQAYQADLMRARVEARDKEIEQLKAEAKKPGNDAVGTEPPDKKPVSKTPNGTAIDEWNTQVKQMVSAGKTKAEAIRQLVVDDPELHEAYIAEHNRAYGRET